MKEIERNEGHTTEVGMANYANNLACLVLEENRLNGKTIAIPSLGIKIISEPSRSQPKNNEP